MAKVRIYELAKELDVDNKVILDYLTGKGVEVKTSSSGVEEDVAADVRNNFGKKPAKAAEPKKEEPKTEVKKAEAPKKEAPKAAANDEKPEKKKNMTFVFNSQFTSSGNKPAPRKTGDKPGQVKPSQPTNRGPIKPRTPGEGAGLRPSQRASVEDEEIIITKPAEPVVEKPQNTEKPAVKNDDRRPSEKHGNDRPDKSARPNREDRPAREDRGGRDGRPDRNNDRNNSGRPDKGGRSNDRQQGSGRPERPDRGNKPGAAAQAPNQPAGNVNKANNGRRDNGKKKNNNYDNRDGGGKNQENFINLEKNGGKKKHNNAPKAPERNEDEILNIKLPDYITIKDLSDRMKVPSSTVIKKLFLKGMMVTLNQEVDYEKAEEIALEFNCICEPEEKVDVIAELLKEDEEDESKMVSRPPVVCVMGHVDHGKTSLLDAIRDTKVTAREAGGITQHIGAYTVEINNQKITFLDTPGHEAFTAMRMRGAQSTDIAILVVAADDGVMPQTIEAINHAKAAGVEIIVAINKIDKPSANVDRVKQELSEYELIPEDWGGSTVFVPVSAHTKEGIDTLLEMILLTADVLELKADPKRNARGLVIEAQLDKGRGAVATVLVQKGTLHAGDPIACGSCYGKVRAMIDDTGERVKEAGPSIPVEIFGLSDVPSAGEIFMAMDSEKEAHAFADTFIAENKNRMVEESRTKMSLDDLFSKIKEGNLKELNLIVKADVQGSVEAVKQSLVKLSNEEVAVKVIHGGVGAINESDIVLASASNAIIIGFNVRPDVQAKSTAEHEGVDIRLYKVIYDAINDVEDAMKGMLDPVYEEKVIGHAEVRQIFKASGIGNIAGSYVLDGYFERNCSVRITREGEQVFEGKLASLKRFKDDVKEVKAGFECGLVIEDYQEFAELDIIEAYIMVEVPR